MDLDCFRTSAKLTLITGRSWPSRARQLSELLALNRPVRTYTVSDGSRAMKLTEGAPAPGQKASTTNDRFLRGCHEFAACQLAAHCEAGSLNRVRDVARLPIDKAVLDQRIDDLLACVRRNANHE